MGLSVLDKVVPRRQRFELSPLTKDERIDYLKTELDREVIKLLQDEDDTFNTLPGTLRSLKQVEHYLHKAKNEDRNAAKCARALLECALHSEDAPREYSSILSSAIKINEEDQSIYFDETIIQIEVQREHRSIN